MCVPVPPNLILSLAMNGLKMMQDNQENKALIDQQNEQNRIAKANAIRLMAQEDLRIRHLQYEIAQSKENKRAISMGQEANSTYVNRSVLLPTFANAGLRFAGDYLSYRTKQLEKNQNNKKASDYS